MIDIRKMDIKLPLQRHILCRLHKVAKKGTEMKRNKLVLFGAVLAAIPKASVPAATITYQYYNILVGTSLASITTVPASSITNGVSLTGNGSAEVLTVPAGDYVTFGLEVNVTNNGGAGLFAANLGLNNSNGTSSQIYSANGQAAGTPLTTPPGLNGSIFTGGGTIGYYDGAGGISAAMSGPGPIFEHFSTASAGLSQYSFANGSFGSLFSKETVTAQSSGTSVFTPVQINSGTGLMIPPFSSSTNYGRVFSFTAGDTIAPLPTLTINVSAVPEPACSATAAVVCAGLSGRRRTKRVRRGA